LYAVSEVLAFGEMRLNVFIVAEETAECPGDIGAWLFYSNKNTIDVRDSELACNVMEGGKSRDSCVDFISFFLFIWKITRLVERLCWDYVGHKMFYLFH
jgi:hypothetical protein